MNKILGILLVLAVITAGLGVLLVIVLSGDRGDDPAQLGGTSRADADKNFDSQLGVAENFTLSIDGQERDFIVYLPAALAQAESVPLVIMYHGFNGSGQNMYQTSGWREVADKGEFMLAFPSALKYHVIRNGQQTYATVWSSYGSAGAELDSAYPDQAFADDVNFTREMLAFIQARYPVQLNRVYAAGFSNGGGFTNRLFNEMSDTFAAYATTGSGLTVEGVNSSGYYPAPGFKPRPVIALIGATDPLLTAEAGVKSFPTDASAMTNSQVRSRFVDAYLQLLELSDSYTYAEHTKDNRASTFTFSTGLDGQPSAWQLEFLIAPKLDHIFPNGHNYPFVAAETYWEFFQQYSL